jgi:transcriptional regulator with XRE-family HTH domain
MKSLYEYVMGELQASKGHWADVARGSGVSKRTLEKIARREIKDPGVSHCERLYAYFKAQSVSAADSKP